MNILRVAYAAIPFFLLLLVALAIIVVCSVTTFMAETPFLYFTF